MQFYALGLGSTGHDNPIGETQTVAKGADAVPPTEEDGLPKTLKSEDGDPLYFAYWDGDYTNVTEDREIFAIYTPLVRLVTYDKTGSNPDEPEVMEVPCLSDLNLKPAVISENNYSTAWFMSYEGEVNSDTPFEQPCLEDPEFDGYEYTYIRFAEIPFTLQLDEETSYSATYTLFCSTYRLEEDEIEQDEMEQDEMEENVVIGYRYTLLIPFDPDEPALMPVDLAEPDNAMFTIVFRDGDDRFEIPLDAFRYSVGMVSDPISLSDLMIMLAESDEPVLVTGANAELALEIEEAQ